MAAFCFVLGNKNELLFAGVVGFLFYLANSPRPRVLLLATGAAVSIVLLGLLDLLRGVPLPSFYNAIQNVKAADLFESLKFVASSNEAFSAHFSMYGVLSSHTPITWGSSFVSLGAAVVPRLLWPGRPEGVYAYYAQRVSAEPGRGYTLLHTTGWYLNFGTIGVIAGAILIGWIWARTFNAYATTRFKEPSWRYAFRVIAPWTFVAYLPVLLRNGIEGYKGVVLEAFLIPTMAIALAFAKKPSRRGKPTKKTNVKGDPESVSHWTTA